MDHGKPSENWTELLRRFRDCEILVQKQPWLVAWKGIRDHYLECYVAGSKCYSETNINDYVLPAWHDAGMKGNPQVEIKLRRGNTGCGNVYLSDAEQRALVLDINSGSGSHWLDQQNVSFHPKTPDYMVVHPNGKFERKAMKSNSRFLPKWARSQ
jgi:hypothetical protein